MVRFHPPPQKGNRDLLGRTQFRITFYAKLMTREELLELVNKELGSTKLTLNERAINEELDDSLDDFGDDEEANAKLVTRIVNRLKRMDGSVHTAVAHEVEEYKRKRKPKAAENPEQETEHKDGEGDKGGDGELSQTLKSVMAKLQAIEDERKAEKAAAVKKNLIASVKKGLEDKYEASELALKPYFVKAALSKLEIPEGDADINELVGKAEKLYNAELKEADIDMGRPVAGGSGGIGSHREDEHEWDDIAERRKRYNPNPQE